MDSYVHMSWQLAIANSALKENIFQFQKYRHENSLVFGVDEQFARRAISYSQIISHVGR